jgi:hypothetical protein
MKKIYFLAVIAFLVLTIKTNAQNYFSDTLDINNVRAVFNSTGINFSQDHNSFFEVPKGSNNITIGCNSLWLAGQDMHGSLFLSGGVGSSAGRDYFPGPLTTDGTDYTDSTTMAQWNRVWKVTKQEIMYHKSHCGTPGYIMPEGIAHWPAHGDTSKHQAYHLAPFYDENGDGIYTPYHGDYPLIRGDEAVFFIFNDKGGLHQATGGTPAGIEVQAMAYSFNCPGDSALDNTVFVNYKIINRSTHWYSSFVTGIYSDINIGNSQNDYIRSDIKRNSFYAYSGTNIDPTLGNYFTAQATTILAGPYLMPDGVDNPAYDSLNLLTCNEAINGLNFGDSVIDNERYGMTGFISFNKSGNPIFSDPVSCSDYHKYLQTKWKDGRKLQYGGYGYDYLTPYGPDCNYIYPALSDPCNWGTNGVLPNGPLNWTEETASNSPGDRQGLAIVGPMTIDAGDFLELDIAFIFGMDYSQPGLLDGWRTVLNQRIDSIRSYFNKDKTPCGGSVTGITQSKTDKSNDKLVVYPNPTTTKLFVSIPDIEHNEYICRIYNIQGTECMKAIITSNTLGNIDVSRLSAGIYQVVACSGNHLYCTKFIKINP